jgi:ATP-binding cassette subfamily B protein
VEHEEQRFDVASRDLFDTALRVNRLFAVTFPIMMAIFNISSVAVMWFGADRVGSGAMPIGNLTAFLTYLMQILMSVLMAVFMFILVPRAAVSADRINEILEIDPLIKDAPDPTPISLTGPGIRVELRNVEFRYPGAEQPVLRDVSFTAEPGRTTAIVGSTGSGKTTLVNLIPRFYDVTGGQVLVDGIDVRDVSREDLWKMLGVIPQQAFLFSGTIASNLRYGDADATAAELNHALDIAQARDFVGEMKDGLESVIDQGGTNVSGGQRQRLAIARALVKRAPLYVFDDSFSALDFRTDARLRATLRRELAGATVIIVAQRVGTILNADRIVVLDEGRVVGVGTHKELMESSETYREIVFSQLTPQEAQVA